jgi:low temperature requirement protein LtrA
MAVNADDALDSRSSAGFGAAYAGMRLLLAIQYWRARSIPATRSIANRHVAGFSIAALLWLLSALVDTPARYGLWLLGAIVDFATPWLAARRLENAPPDAHHLPERFGLFAVILIGEFVAAVMRGIKSQQTWSVPAALCAFSSVAFALLLGWWYFEVAQGASPRRVKSRSEARAFHFWQHAHLLFFAGTAVAGVGFQKAIASASSQLDTGTARILCCAAAMGMMSLTTIGAATERRERGRLRLLQHMVGPVGCLLAALVASSSSPAMIIVLLLTGVFGASLEPTVARREMKSV